MIALTPGTRVRHCFSGRTGRVVLDEYGYGISDFGRDVVSVQWDDRSGASPAYPYVLELEPSL